jgi:hypothetical protein
VIRSVDSEDCACGDRETDEHVLFDCRRWVRERETLKVSRTRMQDLISEQGFGFLKDFAAAVLGRKERD